MDDERDRDGIKSYALEAFSNQPISEDNFPKSMTKPRKRLSPLRNNVELTSVHFGKPLELASDQEPIPKIKNRPRILSQERDVTWAETGRLRPDSHNTIEPFSQRSELQPSSDTSLDGSERKESLNQGFQNNVTNQTSKIKMNEAIEMEEKIKEKEKMTHNGVVWGQQKRCCTLLPEYFTGIIFHLSKWTRNKHPVIKFPFYFLRALGTPIFLNNPISGVIILIGMYLGNPWIATTGVVGCAVAVITSFCLQQDDGLVEAGVTTFHGLLMGLLLPLFIDKPEWYWPTFIPVILLGILSVYVANGIGNLFGHLNLPGFNLSFNVCTLIYLAATGTDNHYLPLKKMSPLMINETFGNTNLDIKEIALGTLKGVGQIYGFDSLYTAVAVLIGILVASPISFLQVILSGIISVATALALAVPPKEIYFGLWGYNGILACTSVGGYWRVFTIKNQILSLFSAIFATCLQAAMGRIFSTWHLPVLGLPYPLTSILFLSFATASCKGYARVPLKDITYPEDHWKKYREELKERRSVSSSTN